MQTKTFGFVQSAQCAVLLSKVRMVVHHQAEVHQCQDYCTSTPAARWKHTSLVQPNFRKQQHMSTTLNKPMSFVYSRLTVSAWRWLQAQGFTKPVAASTVQALH